MARYIGVQEHAGVTIFLKVKLYAALAVSAVGIPRKVARA
jgi:hypothetical protein